MKQLFLVVLVLFATISARGQYSNTSMFEKMNKPLFKQLKTQHGASSVYGYKTSSDQFLIMIEKKVGKEKEIYVANEDGKLLYKGPVSNYGSFASSSKYVTLQRNTINGPRWGVVNIDGTPVLPLDYKDVTFIAAHKEWNGGKGNEYHPALQEAFVTESEDGQTTYFHDFEGAVYKTVEGAQYPVGAYYLAIGTADSKSLYTYDGQEIISQKHADFSVDGTTGVIKFSDVDPVTSLTLVGAQMIKTGEPSVTVPANFNDVRWNSTNKCFEVTLHRDEPYITYNPDSIYKIEFKDDGVKYWDSKQHEKVIEYYEGEGYDQPWGNYYMGMSAKEIAEGEYNIMKSTIKTLKSSTDYYRPIKYPGSYKFNSGKAIQMYMNASNYFEKYIKDERIPNNDPTKAQSRKLRGAMVTGQNEISNLVEEYSRAYQAASAKYTQNQIEAEQEAIRQAARNAQISRGISNIITGFFK